MRNIYFLTMWFLAASLSAAELSFNRDIRPILSDTCFFCHGPDAAHREADLRLDVEADAKDYAIVPGDPEASDFIARILSDDPEMLMPPPDSGKKLSAEQIELLHQWVAQGAPYEPYWAYANPQPSPPPPASDPGWLLDPLDQFVLAKLDEQQLQPSPPADLPTLIRRVTFDLTGLPPSPDQLREVLSDPAPDAYSRYVDRLLASPAYGERMAAYWLDLVRFADTVGYHGDQDHNISPYRDYVLDAFNQNLPFDQFTREQLAGDLLPEATTDQLIASGYNRLLQTTHEGGLQPKEYLAIYAADRVRNVSAVWMGATVGCAQCHDHKYDPYSAADFYALSAFFADVDEAAHFTKGTNALPTNRPPEMEVLTRWQRRRLQDLQTRIDELQQRAELDAVLQSELDSLQAESKRIHDSSRRTMITKAIEPREVRLLPRGNWLDESGPVMQPAVPQFLPQIESDRRANRLDLAEWLVDVDQGVGGLTSRVMVNRLWYLCFGRGISSSLADFGGQGEPPTHGELLDALAIDFADSGWDIKHLLRRMVLSQTYRQSSLADEAALQRDPYNRWFARQSRYRLPAEMVRDNALAVSGLLVNRVGGPSVKPYQPDGYYRHLNFPTRQYRPDRGAKQWRRGVYVHWQRQFLHPMLKALDAPSREECTAQRPRSNTPLEALVLLNDPSMVEAAMALAQRVLPAGEPAAESDQAAIDAAFVLATSRPADAVERQALTELLQAERAHYEANPDQATAMFASTLFEQTDQPLRLAAWTSVMRAILNMHETVTRN
ncbi:PSD1 and planctomycete cytochrome C domain-containing protein [Roseimaritima ulvae]|nr:PSD1 and planctomycete cytochrome C domain-containing protein [Roseimaritima ulvae]